MHEEAFLVLLAMFVVLIAFSGWILGVIAFFRSLSANRNLDSRISRLESSFLSSRSSLQDRITSLNARLDAIKTAPQANEAAVPAADIPRETHEPPSPPAEQPEIQRSEEPAVSATAAVSSAEALPPHAQSEALTPAETVVPVEPSAPASPPPLPPSPPEPPQPPTSSQPPQSPAVPLEFTVGSKWLLWVGAVLSLIGVAYFVKYMYDNSWIGPGGRLAIGTVLGIAAIVQGERFRRKAWDILFQAFTGLGLAIFYICIYFSFQVYQISGQGLSFGLASGVTGLAIVLAVAHNAMPIALVAVVGGFLSPVLLSTGENHPYALFLYVLVLDAVAMGAALFRRWRALDVACFAGTAIMFAGWYQKFCFNNPADQMLPALIFASVFYLLFLLIPTLHSLVRRIPDKPEGVFLVCANTLFWLLMYYRILYPAHAQALGFVCVAQSLIMFALFRGWVNRVGASTPTAEALLIFTLGLVTAAVPLHLKLYGIPIAWGLEAALLAYAGARFNQPITRVASVAALALAAYGLLKRLPMHTLEFLPVLNVPFGSWALVAAAGFTTAWLQIRRTPHENTNAGGTPALPGYAAPLLAGISFLIAFALSGIAMSLEIYEYWAHNYKGSYHPTHTMSSLVLLWSAISAGVAGVLYRRDLIRLPWEALMWACYAIGGIIFVASFGFNSYPQRWLFLSFLFLPRLSYVVALWWAARLYGSVEQPGELMPLVKRIGRGVLEVACYTAMALLLAAELLSWSESTLLNSRMGLSFVSAAWATEALLLIWIGLATRRKLRRITGFVLFGITIAKVLVLDTSGLAQVYRILSFISCGLLAVAAAVFYQKYSHILLQRTEKEEQQ